MQRITIEFGQDTSAYATMEVDVPDGATTEQIVEIALAKADDVGDLEFKASHDWSGLRIVVIHNQQMNSLARDIPIEVDYHCLGQAAADLLSEDASRTRATFQTLLKAARRQGVIESPTIPADARPFDLVLEVLEDLEQTPECAILPGVDATLIDRLDAAALLVRAGDLEHAAIKAESFWGRYGRETTSVLLVQASGWVTLQSENAAGVFQSQPFHVTELRHALSQSFNPDNLSEWLDDPMLRRIDGAVYRSHPSSQASLVARGVKLSTVMEIERELRNMGYAMETSLSDLNDQDDIVLITESDLANAVSLPPRAVELAVEWTRLQRANAQLPCAERPRG